MTTELQGVMARYEEAGIRYKQAVLASLNGDSGGEAIRAAIREFQEASAALKRARGVPARAPHPVPARAARAERTAAAPAFGFALVRRLLSVG